ncbi:hypothetical protein GUITHDRAFT_109591 [Guillardia theta CCMP2712]|uniref:Probable UDP-N-acetylglucosamine--peptide N-acetylglucosaminyltransferase SPINDLY n=1 Tax=Guillardia theta (strain CCMP2712) TaxID=905079 RepID=L1J8S7_GUITC|nr:hypothetical protein GUITHDRAFT_109591 [Guillardia theta CCMP2712]EKX44470.1 hypothetical protein GUITHDRAFT_109591 [Guillardia theta CCMP2712]|eukprot:XP_005831450.1 hypothetical protein GUITHDRAFT_109591 [Guillardia theta CCMP2712]
MKPQDYINRGRALADQDKHEEAILCYEAAISRMTSLADSPVVSESSQALSTPPPTPQDEVNVDMVSATLGKAISLGKLGRNPAATEAMEAALELDPRNTTTLSYLGLLRVIVLCGEGQESWKSLQIREKKFNEGIECYREALSIDPNCTIAAEGLATALTDEGTRLKLLGQGDASYLKYKEASQICPCYAPSHYNLGIVLAERGLVDEAIQEYKRALECCPRYAEAHNNIGVLLKGRNQIQEAIESFKACLELNPNFQLALQNISLALSDLGTVVKSQGMIDDAINFYKQALLYNPKSADAMYNLGVAYIEKNEPEKAIICYELTTQMNPRCAEAYNNLGVIYKDFDNLPRALQCYESALRVKPAFPEALNNMGVVFTMMCQPEDAFAYFNAALQVYPNYSAAYTNLGKFFQDSGDAEKAIHYYEKSLEIYSAAPNSAHNRLLALNYSVTRSRDEISAAHEQWGREIRLQAGPKKNSWKNVKKVERQIKVGYISPDFNKHSVAYFFEAALRCRSRENFHVTCYYAATKEDVMTRRLREMSDSWVNIASKPPAVVAQMIEADQIDILVELSGHTASNRLDVLALHPAPVQVSWIGYPNTTGLDTIDYRFTDDKADPLDTTQKFTEELVRLPDSFLCYTPAEEAGPVAPPPCEALHYVTFGSFNNVAKMNGGVVNLWGKILASLPDSRLLLKSRAFAASQVRESCVSALSEFGVSRNRIDMQMVMSSTSEHLAAYSRMDISLDTFPYAGTTTTVEALLMGVPVITLQARGDNATHSQNVGVSLLTQVGLHELIAKDEDEYCDIAVQLARSPERIRSYRDTLRDRLLSSPLCSGQALMSNVEAEYRRMWTR